ncbi:MAG: elongation factor P, partial [Chloroflexi bacterium]|nr:elongation factor P [Chloroflexota bacterium]
MISVTQLRKGVTFLLDDQIYRVLEYDHYKPGRGAAFVRTKLRNLRTGATVNRTFLSGDRVQEVRLEHQTVQYLYNDGDLYYFMNTETYEQPALSKEILEDVIPYLKEGITLDIEMYEGEPI